MDELKISSKFMRGIVSKIITSVVKKKLGYKVNIQINDLQVTFNGEKAHISVNADAEMNVDDLKKATKIINEEES